MQIPSEKIRFKEHFTTDLAVNYGYPSAKVKQKEEEYVAKL
jgi:hypothetical protein